jgi:thiamine-monophosphate kinase
VHFEQAYTPASWLGHKALAKNISDIAAMGGRPSVAVVALALADGISDSWVHQLYQGMAELARSARCDIVGGDLVRSPVTTISVALCGQARRSQLKKRDGAKPGDILALTGMPGMAAAGLLALRRFSGDGTLPAAVAQSTARFEAFLAALASPLRGACTAYLLPQARLQEGRFLGRCGAARALMDVSDGLSSDVARMARASRVDAELDFCAHPPAALAACAADLQVNAGDLLLHGGEDYELLCAVAPRAFDYVAARFQARFRKPLHCIGRVVSGEGSVWLREGGERKLLGAGGWDHFRRSSPTPNDAPAVLSGSIGHSANTRVRS